MINIHEKTLQDLEFKTVLQQLSEHCITDLGKKKVEEIYKKISVEFEEIVAYSAYQEHMQEPVMINWN